MLNWNRTWPLLLCFFLLAFAGSVRATEFPFPVEIDPKAGSHGNHASRVQDTVTGCWYVYVPGGKYSIGSDKFRNSKEVQVRVSGFYISENEVTIDQFVQYVLARVYEIYVDIPWMRPDSKECNSSRDLATLRCAEVAASFPTLCPYLFGGKHAPGLTKAINRYKESEFDDAEFPETLAAAKEFSYSADRRRLDEAVCDQFRRRLREVKAMGHLPYSFATFSDAEEFAAWRKVRLPTEAQWEVAARMLQRGDARLNGFDNTIIEWCSDYYDHQYFHRTSDFKDPVGPIHGNLQPEDRSPPDSSLLGIGRLKYYRNLRVLRGREDTKSEFSVSRRLYGPGLLPIFVDADKPLGRKMGIRLAFPCPKEH